jgi:hypothetical protein
MIAPSRTRRGVSEERRDDDRRIAPEQRETCEYDERDRES